MFKKAFFIFCFATSVFNSIGQDLITELKGENREIDKMRGFCRGDSVLVSCYYKGPAATTDAIDFKTTWILPDGTQLPVNLSEMKGRQLIGAAKQGDSTFYYFLFEANKKVFLNSLVQTGSSDEIRGHSDDEELYGKLLTGYIENDFLFLLMAEKEGLKLIKIKGMEVLSRTLFTILPLDLYTDNKKLFSFIDNDKINRPYLSSNPNKIIKARNALFIVIDDPAGPHNEQQRSFKATVVKLDLENEGTTLTKYFYEKSRADFRTTVFGNQVFRYTRGIKRREISIYEFETARLVKNQAVPFPNRKDSLFHRSGKVNESGGGQLANPKPFICIDSVGTGIILTVGTELEHDPRTLGPIPSLGVVSLLLTAGSLIAADLYDGPKSYFYHYLKQNSNGVFENTGGSHLINQKINNYEANRAIKAEFNRKLYVSNTKRIFAIYNEAGNSNLRVMKFEK